MARSTFLGILLLLLSLCRIDAQQTATLTERCPPTGIQLRGGSFEPGGIILTAFDRSAIWVYDVERNARYPLPDTAPCGSNCHLSPDALWVTYYNAASRAFGRMRLNGTQRSDITRYATEVSWWSDDTLLVWTPSHDAYLRPEDADERQPVTTRGLINLQPGGYWGLKLEQDGDDFNRILVNTATINLDWVDQNRIPLGVDVFYFNAASWSPDGVYLAYTKPVEYDESAGIEGAEVFTLQPTNGEIVQQTGLFQTYGAVRIGGRNPNGLSWSPDGRRVAFWVMELLGSDPTGNVGQAVIHILDVVTGQTVAYCGFATIEHTPNPPSLVWSPDSSHVAFGGNLPGDDRGYLLLALNIENGIFTELSEGVYPALGTPTVIAWGLP